MHWFAVNFLRVCDYPNRPSYLLTCYHIQAKKAVRETRLASFPGLLHLQIFMACSSYAETVGEGLGNLAT